MIKLKIINKDNFIYNLEDKNGNNYIINIEFLDIQVKPGMGDYICISSELLNSRYAGYSTSYIFGNLENQYGKSNIDLDDIDIIKVIIDDKEIYLKRLYG